MQNQDIAEFLDHEDSISVTEIEGTPKNVNKTPSPDPEPEASDFSKFSQFWKSQKDKLAQEIMTKVEKLLEKNNQKVVLKVESRLKVIFNF